MKATFRVAGRSRRSACLAAGGNRLGSSLMPRLDQVPPAAVNMPLWGLERLGIGPLLNEDEGLG